MPTLKEIKDEIRNIDGVSKMLGRKEIKELPNILWEDEHVKNLVQGTYNNGNGVLVATNKRLIFIDKGMLFGLKVEDFPYDKITSIQYGTGLVLGELKIFASGNSATIKNVEKGRVRDFSEYVRAQTTGANEHTTPAANTQSSSSDVADQIKKLADLKEQGILTEDEFAGQKAKLLDM